MIEMVAAAPFDLTRFRVWIVVAVVFVLQSGLGMYLFDTGAIAVAPSVIVALTVAAFGLLFVAGQPVLPSAAMLWWIGGYFVLTVVGFYRSTGSPAAFEILGARIAGLAFLAAFTGIAKGRSVQTAARWTLVVTTCMGVLLNCVDVVRPLTFSQDLGRSAGFHRNPNIAAGTLTIGLLLALPVLSKRWRAPFVVAGIFGVALTISRGGLLILALGLLLAALQGTVSPSRVLRSALVWGGLAALVLWITGVGARIIDAVTLVTSGSNGWERLMADRGDASAVARLAVVKEAWGLLADHPLLGAGLGATIEWQLGESTHNIYLRLAAEYGILGLLVIPCLLVVLGRRRIMPFQLTVPAFVVALAVWGLFSHNVLDEWPSLVSLAIAAGAPYDDAGRVG